MNTDSLILTLILFDFWGHFEYQIQTFFSCDFGKLWPKSYEDCYKQNLQKV